jgi:hypothetical protein
VDVRGLTGRELTHARDAVVLGLLDFPQTTKELIDRHLQETRDAPGEHYGLPPGLRHDVVFVSGSTFYSRLRSLEKRGLVSSMVMPSHSRSRMWWRPRWTTAASL